MTFITMVLFTLLLLKLKYGLVSGCVILAFNKVYPVMSVPSYQSSLCFVRGLHVPARPSLRIWCTRGSGQVCWLVGSPVRRQTLRPSSPPRPWSLPAARPVRRPTWQSRPVPCPHRLHPWESRAPLERGVPEESGRSYQPLGHSVNLIFPHTQDIHNSCVSLKKKVIPLNGRTFYHI